MLAATRDKPQRYIESEYHYPADACMVILDSSDPLAALTGSLDVYEEYVSIPTMRPMVVLVTADPNDVNGSDDDDSDEEEEYIPSWKR